jgi:hypothetical protein
MMLANDIKPQLELTEAELSLIVQVPAGIHSGHPDAPKFNRQLFGQREPITPDPPGSQRRTRAKRGLSPDGIMGRLLRLATDTQQPITWVEIMSDFESRVGVAPALQRLVDRGNFKCRDLYEKETGKKWKQWTLVDRKWSQPPAGVTVIDKLSRFV